MLDFERAGLGALQGATNSKETPPRPPTIMRILSGVFAGAGAGSMFGPFGAIGGGIVGGIGGAMS